MGDTCIAGKRSNARQKIVTVQFLVLCVGEHVTQLLSENDISDCTRRLQQTRWTNYKIIFLRLCRLFTDLKHEGATSISLFLWVCADLVLCHDWPEGVVCDAAIEHGCARSTTICRQQRHSNLTDRSMAANMHQPPKPYLRRRYIHYLQLFHLTWSWDRTGEEEPVSEHSTLLV